MSEQNSDPSRPFEPPVPPTQPPTAPPAPPEAPPAPPTTPPPAPGLPPVPQYGEYAPEGYVSPVAPVAAAEPNPYGVPGYTAPTVPTYGTVPVPAYAPPVRKRRTWDTVLTVIMLVLGLFGLGAGLLYAVAFADPGLLDSALASQGMTGHLTPGAAPAIIIISHLVLYVLALGLSIPLLIKGRVVVFWIPLAIGVVAAVIFWISLGSVIFSDPNLLNSYMTGS